MPNLYIFNEFKTKIVETKKLKINYKQTKFQRGSNKKLLQKQINKSKSLFENLPQEIHLKIFSFCNENDLIIMQKVSHKFNNIINSNLSHLFKPFISHLIIYNKISILSNKNLFINLNMPTTSSTLNFINEFDNSKIFIFAKQFKLTKFNFKSNKFYSSSFIDGSGINFLTKLLNKYYLNGKLEFERITFDKKFLSQFYYNSNLR